MGGNGEGQGGAEMKPFRRGGSLPKFQDVNSEVSDIEGVTVGEDGRLVMSQDSDIKDAIIDDSYTEGYKTRWANEVANNISGGYDLTNQAYKSDLSNMTDLRREGLLNAEEYFGMPSEYGIEDSYFGDRGGYKYMSGVGGVSYLGERYLVDKYDGQLPEYLSDLYDPAKHNNRLYYGQNTRPNNRWNNLKRSLFGNKNHTQKELDEVREHELGHAFTNNDALITPYAAQLLTKAKTLEDRSDVSFKEWKENQNFEKRGFGKWAGDMLKHGNIIPGDSRREQYRDWRNTKSGDYLTDPAEVHTRYKKGQKHLKNLGIFDHTTGEPFTEEHYNKVKEWMLTDDFKNADSDIKEFFGTNDWTSEFNKEIEKDDMVEIFNNVADVSQRMPSDMSKYGGQLPKAQDSKETTYQSQIPIDSDNYVLVAPTLGEVEINAKDPRSWLKKTYQDYISPVGHGILDVAGLVPALGEPFDLANAAWYGAEGNYVDAGLSSTAAIPFAGWASTGGKWTKNIIKNMDEVTPGGGDMYRIMTELRKTNPKRAKELGFGSNRKIKKMIKKNPEGAQNIINSAGISSQAEFLSNFKAPTRSSAQSGLNYYGKPYGITLDNADLVNHVNKIGAPGGTTRLYRYGEGPLNYGNNIGDFGASRAKNKTGWYSIDPLDPYRYVDQRRLGKNGKVFSLDVPNADLNVLGDFYRGKGVQGPPGSWNSLTKWKEFDIDDTFIDLWKGKEWGSIGDYTKYINTLKKYGGQLPMAEGGWETLWNTGKEIYDTGKTIFNTGVKKAATHAATPVIGNAAASAIGLGSAAYGLLDANLNLHNTISDANPDKDPNEIKSNVEMMYDGVYGSTHGHNPFYGNMKKDGGQLQKAQHSHETDGDGMGVIQSVFTGAQNIYSGAKRLNSLNGDMTWAKIPDYNEAFEKARTALGPNKEFTWINPKTGHFQAYSTNTREDYPDQMTKDFWEVIIPADPRFKDYPAAIQKLKDLWIELGMQKIWTDPNGRYDPDGLLGNWEGTTEGARPTTRTYNNVIDLGMTHNNITNTGTNYDTVESFVDELTHLMHFSKYSDEPKGKIERSGQWLENEGATMLWGGIKGNWNDYWDDIRIHPWSAINRYMGQPMDEQSGEKVRYRQGRTQEDVDLYLKKFDEETQQLIKDYKNNPSQKTYNNLTKHSKSFRPDRLELKEGEYYYYDPMSPHDHFAAAYNTTYGVAGNEEHKHKHGTVISPYTGNPITWDGEIVEGNDAALWALIGMNPDWASLDTYMKEDGAGTGAGRHKQGSADRKEYYDQRNWSYDNTIDITAGAAGTDVYRANRATGNLELDNLDKYPYLSEARAQEYINQNMGLFPYVDGRQVLDQSISPDHYDLFKSLPLYANQWDDITKRINQETNFRQMSNTFNVDDYSLDQFRGNNIVFPEYGYDSDVKYLYDKGGEIVKHTIVKGDTGKRLKAMYGTELKDILKHNDIKYFKLGAEIEIPKYKKGGFKKFFRTKKQREIDEANENILEKKNDGVNIEVGPVTNNAQLYSTPHQEFNTKWTNIANQIAEQQATNSGDWRYANLVGPFNLPYQLEQERLQSMPTDHPDYNVDEVGEFNALFQNKQNTQRYHLEQGDASQKKVNEMVSGYPLIPLDILKMATSDQVAQGINVLKGEEWNDPVQGYVNSLLDPVHGFSSPWNWQTGQYGDWNYGLSKPLKYTYNSETGNLDTPLLSEDLNVRKNAQVESIIDNNYLSNDHRDYYTDFSNKNEMISDALDIENPYLAFGVNVGLDPTTWGGVGLLNQGRKGVGLFRNSLRSGDDAIRKGFGFNSQKNYYPISNNIGSSRNFSNVNFLDNVTEANLRDLKTKFNRNKQFVDNNIPLNTHQTNFMNNEINLLNKSGSLVDDAGNITLRRYGPNKGGQFLTDDGWYSTNLHSPMTYQNMRGGMNNVHTVKIPATDLSKYYANAGKRGNEVLTDFNEFLLPPSITKNATSVPYQTYLDEILYKKYGGRIK